MTDTLCNMMRALFNYRESKCVRERGQDESNVEYWLLNENQSVGKLKIGRFPHFGENVVNTLGHFSRVS